ncbi:MAG: efflux RND transporter periplasmic adaptor subunit [Vicinamibacterales bacterium]
MTRFAARTFAPAALVTLAIAAGCSHDAPEEVESHTVVPVQVETVRTGDIQAAVHATGLVAAAPGAELLVVAPEPARIAELPRAEGERVAAGDLLVRFDIPASGAEVARQQADIARAEAQIANARAAQARAKDLFDRGVAARKELEDADRDLAEAQAALSQGRAGLAAATTTAARAEVRAPFAGVIARRMHNPGDLVDAATADPVLRLVDPRRIEVVASIALGDLPRVRAGATAHLATPLEGALSVVAPPAAVDATTGAAPVRLRFTGAPPMLAVGLPVSSAIDADARTGVVLVPAVAVVREGEEAAVFVADGDKAVRRVVALGVSDGERIEVTSGLAAGDRVSTHGQAGLPDGATIAVEGAAPARNEKP